MPANADPGGHARRLCGRWLAGIASSNPAGGMNVSCECSVLEDRGPSDGLITRPEESYRVCCVQYVCDREASTMRRSWPTVGCRSTKKICWQTLYCLII
jgi:hypothetical protein